IEQQQAIDIGLMQISWRWQQQRFTDAEQALIPLQNLKAGAAILREQFENTQDWWQAVGRYHDPGQDPQSLKSAKHYRAKVRQHWTVAF
ncbi:MAG: transglycosylase SLT domain-containing protein, partial [Porticoccaceae bacterium]|nr:transglycosylase SLT domain-containing protein [Porticoccaceae bacterium]